MSDDRDLEHSDFSGEFTDGDVTVLVDISRPRGSAGGWTLEVTDQNEGSTIWEDPFPTDKQAFEEFLATIERDGIRSFLDDPDPEGSMLQ